MEPGDLLYAAARPREAVADAKKWLRENTQHSPNLLNAVNVVARMEKQYPGGWRSFCSATGNVSERFVDEMEADALNRHEGVREIQGHGINE